MQYIRLGANAMISEEIRNLLRAMDPKYNYCNLSSHLLVDSDLLELADLVISNPYITCIDLAYNPEITVEGVNRLQQRVPAVKIVNCSCLLTIEEAMEISTLARVMPKVPCGAVFLHPSKQTVQSLQTDSLTLTEHFDSTCTL